MYKSICKKVYLLKKWAITNNSELKRKAVDDALVNIGLLIIKLINKITNIM